MDGLFEPLDNAVRIETVEVTVKLIAIGPATGAFRTGFGDAEPENTVRPDAQAHAKTEDRRKIHVETLDGILDGAAALQITMIANRLAATFDGAGDLPQQCGLEWRCGGSLHLSARVEPPNVQARATGNARPAATMASQFSRAARVPGGAAARCCAWLAVRILSL